MTNRRLKLKSSHPFNIIDGEIVFDPINIKEGELPIIPKIWYEYYDE